MPKPTRKSGPHSHDTCPLAIAWMFKLMLDCSVRPSLSDVRTRPAKDAAGAG